MGRGDRSSNRGDRPRYARDGETADERDDRGDRQTSGREEWTARRGTEARPPDEEPTGQSERRSVTSQKRRPAVLAAALPELVGVFTVFQTDLVLVGVGIWTLGGLLGGWSAPDTEEAIGNAIAAALGVFVAGSVLFALYAVLETGRLSVWFFLGELYAIWLFYLLFTYAVVLLIPAAWVGQKFGSRFGPAR